MSRDYYGDDDIEQQELLDEQEIINDLEIPDVPWKEDIEKIPDHDLKLKEIQKAEKFITEKKALDDRLENGEISLGAYDSIIRPKVWKASTRCGLASVRLTRDKLGDLSEDAELLVTGEGDLKMTELKDRIKDTIEKIGPRAAEELADSMHDEERLGDDAHELIKRQVRIRKNKR